MTHEDHGVGETSSCSVRTVELSHGVNFGSNQPQLFQVGPSFATGSTGSLFVGPLHGGPVFHSPFSVQPVGYIVLKMGWKRLKPPGDTGTCQRLDQGMEPRKGREQSRTPRHTDTATGCTSHREHCVPIMHTLNNQHTALHVVHCQISSHNRVNEFCQYVHSNSSSYQGTAYFFVMALPCH